LFAPASCRAGTLSERPTPTPTAAPTHNPNSLAEAAAKIKLRKTPNAEGAGVVINNENLKSYAEKGKLTTASGQPSQAKGVNAGAPGPGSKGQRKMSDEAKKAHWRGVYSRQKQLVESIEKRIKELNSEIPALQADFYKWDDPAYRDGVIKPKIDQKMKELNELQKRLPVEKAKLPKILEDARRDGALPGWFRDLT